MLLRILPVWTEFKQSISDIRNHNVPILLKKLGRHSNRTWSFRGNICINALYTSSVEKSCRIKVVINVLANHLIDMLHDLWNIIRVGRRKQSGEIMLSHCCQAVIITNLGARIRQLGYVDKTLKLSILVMWEGFDD